VDFETRRQKQQQLMAGMVERKIRRRARQLYDTRYRKVRVENPRSAQEEPEASNETFA
jgi:hypothetical protein